MPPSYENSLDPVLHDIVARWELPGLAVGIVHDGEIAYAATFGVQSLDAPAPITADSRFCVASVSKIFVATAVMQLAERGLVCLDAPLVQYLPYFALSDGRYGRITVRQLLSHTSGMPDLDEFEYDDLWKHPEHDERAGERFVRGLRDRRLIADPGERFYYSNIGYNVLGELIAEVSALTFETYLKERVLVPAGMPHSTFLLEEVPVQLLAVPHLRAPQMMVSPLYPYHRGDAPASNLHTTLADMCHWTTLCLNQGRFDGRELLPPAGFARMWTPVAKRGGVLYADMGLGWNLGTYAGERAVSHGGMGAGLSAFWLILPEKRQGAVMMCADESGAIARVREAMLDAMMGRPPRAGTVSWAVPISRALAAGGIEAARACYEALKAGGSQEIDFDADGLIMLALHLVTVDKLDLAIDVLELNLLNTPDHAPAHWCLANAYLRMGEPGRAEASLVKALAFDPGDVMAARLLERLRSASPPGGSTLSAA